MVPYDIISCSHAFSYAGTPESINPLVFPRTEQWCSNFCWRQSRVRDVNMCQVV